MAQKKTPKTPIQETKVKESQKKPATGYIVETPVDGVKPSVPPGVYYDWNPIMSKNRLFSFVVGIRGGGKSYGATKFAINAYLKRGKKSIWLRRRATQIDDVFLRAFFKEMATNSEFPGYDFMVGKSSEKGISFGYIKRHEDEEWQQFMLFMPLSTALGHKSAFASQYDLIWFDEFLIDPISTTDRYINGWAEPTVYFEFFESVVRTRPGVRGIFIGNALDSINPYFVELNLDMNINEEWTMSEFAVIHNYKNDKFVEYKKAQSAWGRFLETTRYGQYNMHNVFISENDDFIEQRSQRSKLVFNFKWMKETYSVYSDYLSGKVYICPATDLTYFTYAFTTEDMKPNYLLMDTLGKSSNIKHPLYIVKRAFSQGYLRFDSKKTKAMLYELITTIT